MTNAKYSEAKMKLDVNKQYSGFVIRQAAYIDEIQSEAYVMEHAYSGAIQVWRIF